MQDSNLRWSKAHLVTNQVQSTGLCEPSEMVPGANLELSVLEADALSIELATLNWLERADYAVHPCTAPGETAFCTLPEVYRYAG